MASRTTWNILLPTIAASGLLLIVGVGGAWYVHHANRAVSVLLDDHLAAAQSAQRLVLAIRELRLKLDRFVTSGDEAYLRELLSPMAVIEAECIGQGLEADSNGADSFRCDEFRERLALLREADPGDARRSAAAEWVTLINGQRLPTAEEHLERRQRIATETSSTNQVVARRIGLGLLLLGVCGAAAGLLVGFGIARSVHRSLVEISVPVRDMAGRLNEVVGPIQVASDTDLAQLDGSLRMLADKTADVVRQLQESQRQSLRHEQLAAVGQLAAGLAHELRNPLMSVKLIVQAAAERSDPSLKLRDLEILDGEVSRLERMLQTFLDFARPPRPKKEEVDICRLIETTLDVLELRAVQQDVKFHFSGPPSLPRVEADAAQFRQVLLNLLINALDVLPSGGNIWIEARANGDPFVGQPDFPAVDAAADAAMGLPSTSREFLAIAITDDGPGLSTEIADKVFEPFVSTKDTGIGLGLSICQQILESHDGVITASNRPAGGAVFTIWLPTEVGYATTRGAVPISQP